MNQSEHNKAFILKYYSAMYGVKKTQSLVRRFVSNQKLIDHIFYFDKIFPNAKLVADEVIAEGNKVFVKARFFAKHVGEVDGVPPTFKEVEVPFAICYTIQNDKIVNFWAISDQVEFLEQLGVAKTNPSYISSLES